MKKGGAFRQMWGKGGGVRVQAWRVLGPGACQSVSGRWEAREALLRMAFRRLALLQGAGRRPTRNLEEGKVSLMIHTSEFLPRAPIPTAVSSDAAVRPKTRGAGTDLPEMGAPRIASGQSVRRAGVVVVSCWPER